MLANGSRNKTNRPDHVGFLPFFFFSLGAHRNIEAVCTWDDEVTQGNHTLTTSQSLVGKRTKQNNRSTAAAYLFRQQQTLANPRRALPGEE